MTHTFISNLYPGLTTWNFVLFIAIALILGMAKAGLNGFGIAMIPLMALIFGAKESTGVILPMLITADIMAVAYYRRHAEWKYILRILPWVAAGILAALFLGDNINDNVFRTIMMTIVWIMLILMVINDLWKRESEVIPHNMAFGATMGFTGGFATMIGNAAGPVFTLYFLAMRLPKKEFIGTGAWLYLIMNTGKFPLQALVWENITTGSLMLNLIAVPFIAIGIYAGIKIVDVFSEKWYRYFVIITTIASSILLFI
jgi:hypothetical protein